MAWIETDIDPISGISADVATREGGVDRNTGTTKCTLTMPTSPPARVAWIETKARWHLLCGMWVATREGGVDRNMTSDADEDKGMVRRHPRGWRG